MRKRLLKVSLMTVLAIGSTAFATEFRTPWLSERGPIRYVFEKKDSKKYSLDLWTTGYMKYANKAYMKQSTDPRPLTELFFNKSEFTISEAFSKEMRADSVLYQFHNPYLYVMRFSPRATYFDWGMDFGGRFEYPVYKDKGRIGLRATIPFRTVRMERNDDEEQAEEGVQQFVLRESWREGQTIRNIVGGPNDGQGQIFRQDIWAWAINGELLRQIPYIKNGVTTRGLFPITEPVNNGLMVTNKPYQFTTEAAAGDMANGAGLVFSYYPKKFKKPPFHKVGALKFANDANDYQGNNLEERNYIRDDFHPEDSLNAAVWPVTGPSGANQTTVAPRALLQLPPDGAGMAQDTFYMVTYDDDAVDYTDFPRKQWKNIWLSSVHDAAGDETAISNGTINDIEAKLKAFDDDMEQWLWEHGFVFATQQRTGLGDIDLDLFYAHSFNEKWNGELFVGVRFPTGIGDDYWGNPYKVHTGNGEHWEIKLGGMIAWQPLKWMNTKLDAYVSFVLESKEDRCAVFEGAKIKNIGPKVEADVDWIYFVGRFDFNFFHPKTSDLSSTIGYEFYYKTEDHVHFDKCKVNTWLGKKWNNDTHEYEESPQELSNHLAQANTEGFSHKIRMEGRYQANKWLELFAGGSYVFAGQYVSVDADCHVGANVKF